MQNITELEAVNTMLATIGSSEITSLENPMSSDAQMAQSCLLMALRKVESEKWYFNTEYNYPLVVNSEGEITVPNNIIALDFTGRFGVNHDVVIRNSKLYDKTRHTYKFDETLYATIYLMLDFDELPESAKIYVLIRASRDFQDQVQGDPNSHSWTREDEERARAQLVCEELRQTKPSFGAIPHRDPNVAHDLDLSGDWLC